MRWEDFLADNRPRFQTAYEAFFAEQVLPRVTGLSPDIVRCQREYTDGKGVARRVDFAIEEGPLVRIAIEVDGWDKSGRGRGMTRTEFMAWSRRELDLTSRGWTVLRFPNSLVRRFPEECARHLTLTLRKVRAVAAAAARPHATSTTGLSEADAAELARLERKRLQALREVEVKLARAESENRGMRTIAVSFTVVFLVTVTVILLLIRGGGSESPPTVSDRAADPIGGRSEASGAPPGAVGQASIFCEGGVDWSEAGRHLGELVKIRGRIVGARYLPAVPGRPTFLNVGRDFPDPSRLTLVVWGSNRENFPVAPEQAYLNRVVCVYGRVENHDGQLEIEVDAPGDLEVSQGSP
ncbi:MAG: hypothetical protein D6701_12760 [Gemmatimonadetes bacterium]|nr:MAG: hypothetical protein D6701_12760 [Gemmatimonadota bacterium]